MPRSTYIGFKKEVKSRRPNPISVNVFDYSDPNQLAQNKIKVF